MFKKLIYGFFIIVLFLSYAACSPKETKSPVSGVSPTTKPAAEALSEGTWQASWQKIRDAGKKDGKVVVYMEASASPAREPLIKALKEKVGLEAEIVVLVSGDLNARVFNERRAGLLYNDIIITGGGSMANTLVPAGVFGPLADTFILPEVKDEKLWREGKIPWFDKDRTVLSSVLFVQEGATINSELVKKDELKSYTDLLNPKWKGHIVMNDPTIPGKGINIFQTMRKLMGENYLRELAKQEIILSRDHRQMAEWVARGKFLLGLAISTPLAEEMRLAGGSIDYVEFKEGAGLTTGGSFIGIMDRPAHPNASRVFVNWFLSREGQTLWSQSLKYISRRIDTPTEHLQPINVPKPGVKYIDDTAEFYLEWPEGMKLAREILIAGPR